MCGIFGAINFSGYFTIDDYDKFVKLTDIVSYRGPDASGYLAINLNQNSQNKEKFHVFLGHRRLSIIDLTDRGNQPMTDGEALWIVFNGEIFNYIELKMELIQKGHIFNTNTDTEVILKIYKEYGDSGFEKLNGMWAFAILDLSNKKIILSRDRFSIKPLYFVQINNKLYFASEIKQLLPILEKKEINQDITYTYLSQGLLDTNEHTFFKEINKVKPKTNLIIQIQNGKIKERCYWDYKLKENKLTIDDAVEGFRELLLDSIKIRLRSDVKIGGLLSGGLDSSTIAVVANDLQNGNFETYSVVAEDKKYSEERFVNILSTEKRIKNHKLYFKPDEALDSLHKVVYHNEEPFGGFSVVAQYKILEKVKKETDITVLLSGQGGDEILMGYLKYFFFNLKELLLKGRLTNALKQIFLSLIHRTVLYQFRYSDAKRYMPAFISFFSKRNPPTYLKIKGEYEPIWRFDSLIHRQIIDIDRYSVPALTHYEDRNSMAHSLEIRLPFLDHRLVNFVLTLPVEMKLNRG